MQKTELLDSLSVLNLAKISTVNAESHDCLQAINGLSRVLSLLKRYNLSVKDLFSTYEKQYFFYSSKNNLQTDFLNQLQHEVEIAI